MNTSWLTHISQFAASMEDKGAVFIAFPGYRPDLAKAIAHHMNIMFYDFREKEMAPLGTKAGEMELARLDDTISLLTRDKGLLLFNVEALLASKQATERHEWFSKISALEHPSVLIIPLTLFADEASRATSRILSFGPDELPDQGLISRLIH